MYSSVTFYPIASEKGNDMQPETSLMLFIDSKMLEFRDFKSK